MSQRSRARKYRKIFKPLRQMHNRKYFVVKLGLPIGDINHNGRIYPEGMFDKAIESFREKNKDVKFIRPSLDHPVKAIHINVSDMPKGAQELLESHARQIQGSFSIRSIVPSVGDHVHQDIGKIQQLDLDTYREQFHIVPPTMANWNMVEEKCDDSATNVFKHWQDLMLAERGLTPEMLQVDNQVEFATAFSAIEQSNDKVAAMSAHIASMLGNCKTISDIRNQAANVGESITSKERKEEIIQATQQGIVDAIRASVNQRMIESKFEEANKAFEESVASGEYDQHFALTNLFADGYKTKYDVLVYSVDAITAHKVPGMYLPDYCPRGSHLTENSLGHQACLEYLLKNANAGVRLVTENLLAVHVEDQYFICQLSQIVLSVTCDKHFDFLNGVIKPRPMGKTVSIDLGDNDE